MEDLRSKSLADLQAMKNALAEERDELHEQASPEAVRVATNLYLRGRMRDLLRWGNEIRSGDESRAKAALIEMITMMQNYNESLIATLKIE